MRRLGPALFTVAALLASPLPSLAQSPAERFTKTVQSVEMRDGVHLNTEVYVPTGSGGPWPILLTRTPYGLRHDEAGFATTLSGYYAELAADGYIFVFQDIRGRYGSEGSFVMQRPPRDPSEPGAIDEGTDTWDTIDWVLDHVDGHNGRVGMLGISYGGWLTVMALIDPHPALAAASPQASPADMFLGDDFLHNGAFRLSASFGYVALMETGNTNQPFPFDQHDTYEWFLELGPLSNVDRLHFFGEKPTWNAFMANTSYTDYWQRQAAVPYLRRVQVPTLNVAGWWDAEDLYGPFAIYRAFERHDSEDENFLVVGPWRHGGWASGEGSSLGEIPFGSATARHFREQIQRSFFAHYLKREASTPWAGAEARVFETGDNLWRSYDRWPPAGEARRLYLAANGGLSFERPSSAAAFDAYISDPAKPVPYMPRPIPGFWQGGQALWKVTDQRFVDGRPDVLTYRSEPLEEGLSIVGPVTVELHASTTGTDADWIVKLIDVYPEDDPKPELRGFQLMIADEVFRARFRDSFDLPRAVPADEVLTYSFSLGDRHHRFRPGHRIMVQVQSTWFPLIGRNPQTFVEIPAAQESDYRPATQRIHRDARHPSHLVLRVPKP